MIINSLISYRKKYYALRLIAIISQVLEFWSKKKTNSNPLLILRIAVWQSNGYAEVTFSPSNKTSSATTSVMYFFTPSLSS